MKLLRKLVIFVIVFNLFTIVCSATTVSSRITVLKSSTEVTSICSQANTSVGLNSSGKKIMSYTSSNGALSFNNARYYKLTAEQKEPRSR